MNKRTSKMLRIPGALVPAVREMTLAWHLREREVGTGRGPFVPRDGGHDDADAGTVLERQRGAVERLREDLEAAEQELADTELRVAGL